MEPNAPTLSRTLPPLATPKQVRMARQPDSPREPPGGGSGEGSLVAPQEAQSQRSDAMVEVDDPQTIGSLGGPYQKYGPSGGFAKRIRKSESRGLEVRGLRGRDHLVGRAGRFLDLARPFAGRLQVWPQEVRRPQAEALDRRRHPGQRAVQVVGEVPG